MVKNKENVDSGSDNSDSDSDGEDEEEDKVEEITQEMAQAQVKWHSQSQRKNVKRKNEIKKIFLLSF